MHTYSCTNDMSLALAAIKLGISGVPCLICSHPYFKKKESKVVMQTGERLARWMPRTLTSARNN